MRFGAFIITFHRPHILVDTIKRLLQQTVLPEIILIVDNSLNSETRELVQQLDDARIRYHSTGANLGPAGGAAVGIRMLAEDGYDAILWQDDDDPPRSELFNAELLQILQNNPSAGMVGTTGSLVNYRTGAIQRVSDEYLRERELLFADFIGGNQHIIINAKTYTEHGCLPTGELFFGFEDLDVSLQIKAAGYDILVPTNIMLENRAHSNRLNLEPTPFGDNVRQNAATVWRQYYSYRSMAYIYLHKQKMYSAYAITSMRGLLKGALAFKAGYKTGYSYLRLIAKGLYDGTRKRLGFTVPPIAKY